MPTGAAPLPAPYTYQAIPFQLGPVDGANPVSMSDVTTLLINPTSGSRTYSYLPPHGRVIASLGSILIDGDLIASLGNLRYNRKLNGLKNDVQLGNLNIFRNVRQLVSANVLAAQAISVGDLLYLSSGNAVPASVFTWDTDLATTQGEIKAVFLGIAVEAKAVTSGNQQVLVDIAPTSAYYMTCTSQTHEVGDTMGVAKASGSALVNSTLVKAVATSSIARVVQRTPSVSTKVVVRFQSAYWGSNVSGEE